MTAKTSYTACLVIIGNEILSGRTQDANLQYLAKKLTEWGVRLAEARVIPDVEDVIVGTINACRAAFDYVFTTGGIGPTHDDITAEAIAKAFGVGLVCHQETFKRMEAVYKPGEFNEARQKMCYLPAGAAPIENAVSIAPGFQIENVFVLAGVPSIMRAMVDTLRNRLVGGAPIQSRSLSVYLAEGVIAEGFAALQKRYPDTDMGSYPFYRSGRFGTSLVIRGTDPASLDAALGELDAMVRGLGADPVAEQA
ncbi:MAG: competence/damage-inducible protein A [Rhodospirillaceae bacterium]|nr:competence/damage-inducible protein A [Rhodospirillaceae bacterium]